jgi:hypothetical protein
MRSTRRRGALRESPGLTQLPSGRLSDLSLAIRFSVARCIAEHAGAMGERVASGPTQGSRPAGRAVTVETLQRELSGAGRRGHA